MSELNRREWRMTREEDFWEFAVNGVSEHLRVRFVFILLLSNDPQRPNSQTGVEILVEKSRMIEGFLLLPDAVQVTVMLREGGAPGQHPCYCVWTKRGNWETVCHGPVERVTLQKGRGSVHQSNLTSCSTFPYHHVLFHL